MIKKGLHKTLAEVGKIKTGYRGAPIQSSKGKEFQPPKKLDHFIITTTERDPKTGNLLENGPLMEKLGGKPRELRIRLPFDSIDKNFFTQFQAYSGGKKLCAGDGEKAERRGEITVRSDKSLEVKGDTRHEVPCDFETCPIAVAGKCKVSGILSAFLPESGDLGGVYKYRTHSWNGVSSILAALEFFAENTGGILQGLPLKLVLLKKATEDHGNIYYATVVLDGEEILGLRRLALEEKRSRLRLGYDVRKVEEAAAASGVLQDTDPEDEVEAEFYVEDEKHEQPPAPPKQEKGAAAADVERKLKDRQAPAKVEAKPEAATGQGAQIAQAQTSPAAATGANSGQPASGAQPEPAAESETREASAEKRAARERELDIF